MIPTNLFTKQKQIYRLRKQIDSYHRGQVGVGGNRLGDWDGQVHAAAAAAAAAAAKSLQLCLTLCDPIDSSPPGSPVPGILQARTLQWVAISFSSA